MIETPRILSAEEVAEWRQKTSAFIQGKKDNLPVNLAIMTKEMRDELLDSHEALRRLVAELLRWVREQRESYRATRDRGGDWNPSEPRADRSIAELDRVLAEAARLGLLENG